MNPILVLGATGGQGGAVHTALRERGLPVRVMVRRPASPAAQQLAAAGSEVVAGDLTDLGALRAAMHDVAAVSP